MPKYVDQDLGVQSLRRSARALTEAHANLMEEGPFGAVTGATADMIFGLATSIESLVMLLEENDEH